MTGIIRDLKFLNWTAAKITQYGHGLCSLDGRECGCAPEEHAFDLIEEGDAEGRGDTSRFLAAGARRSLWLRVRQGQMKSALPLLREALGTDAFVMMESNSILGFVRPELYLVVLDSRRHDFKPSAREFLSRADAFVPIGNGFDPRAWTGFDAGDFDKKPVFPVQAGEYRSLELSGFVRQRLGLPPRSRSARAQEPLDSPLRNH